MPPSRTTAPHPPHPRKPGSPSRGTASPSRRPRLLALAVIGAAAILTAGVLVHEFTGAGDDAPRALNATEAQQLALARFGAYESGTLGVHVTLPGSGRDDGTDVHGIVDYRAHRAVGRYTTGRPESRDGGLLAWDTGGLAVAQVPEKKGQRPAAQAAALDPGTWSQRAYTTDPLDAALRLVIAMGTDRPDNPQLLAQAGPRRLGRASIDGTDYTLYSGPRPRDSAKGGRSPLTYWVDDKGRLGRLEARIASLPGPARVDFTPNRDADKVPGRPWERVGGK
ncbi:hypothetical protein ABT160_12305 [Streptomyces sp. NPDC001941]|uniref:hypothetical protein n=1 Tax=Streptomyces sp. NPDC001941 TaxID=3154659 RepID=UPI003333F4B1